MTIDTILRLLKNSGFHVLGVNDAFIQLEDPSCILRSFETFIEYAWMGLGFITALLLFGWAISMIRGAKNDIFSNLKNLTIIFAVLTAAKPLINLIWGGDLFARGCQTITVSTSEVRRLVDLRNSKLAQRNESDLFEEFDIYDSGAFIGLELPNEIPYALAPLISSGAPETVSVSNSGNNYATGAFAMDSLPVSKNMAGVQPVRALTLNSDVIYQDSDGGRYKKTGGTRAWRNTNPGNIRYSEFARKLGAIGEAGNFAVFPDEATGMTAIRSLLQSKNYYRLSIQGAISRWAPPIENDTAAYHKQIGRLTNLDINTPISQLNDVQLESVARAIREIEGWQPGRQIML